MLHAEQLLLSWCNVLHCLTSCAPQAKEGPDTCKPKVWAAANPGKTHAVFSKDTCPGGSVPALPKQVLNR